MASERSKPGFDIWEWRNRVFDDDRIAGAALATAYLISQLFREEKGYAWPSVGYMAEFLGISEKTVRSHIDALVKAGYRRIHVLLKREGHVVNHKRLFRLYRQEKLSVRKRGGRKRAIGTRSPMLVPIRPNERWSLDFVSDQLTDGRRFRVLTVVDDCTRECLALVADTSILGLRLARELNRLVSARGKPQMIVSDNVLRVEGLRQREQDISFCKLALAA